MTTTRVVPQVVSDLQTARDLLARSRWLQSMLYDPPDAYCAVGAVYHAIGFYEHALRAVRAFAALRLLDRAVGDHGYGPGMATVDFNNKEGRTKDEVLDAFDKAIALGLNAVQIAG